MPPLPAVRICVRATLRPRRPRRCSHASLHVRPAAHAAHAIRRRRGARLVVRTPSLRARHRHHELATPTVHTALMLVRLQQARGSARKASALGMNSSDSTACGRHKASPSARLQQQPMRRGFLSWSAVLGHGSCDAAHAYAEHPSPATMRSGG